MILSELKLPLCGKEDPKNVEEVRFLLVLFPFLGEFNGGENLRLAGIGIPPEREKVGHAGVGRSLKDRNSHFPGGEHKRFQIRFWRLRVSRGRSKAVLD